MDTDALQTDAALPASPQTERLARFETLLTANRPALARLAASYATSPADRDDLLQEIAMGLWLALPGFRAECSERTFLFRIAHNRCISHLARRRPQVSLDELQIDPVDHGVTPDAGVADAQQTERLQAAVHRLPLTYRQVIVLLRRTVPASRVWSCWRLAGAVQRAAVTPAVAARRPRPALPLTALCRARSLSLVLLWARGHPASATAAVVLEELVAANEMRWDLSVFNVSVPACRR